MSGYTCQLRTIDSATLKCKPSNNQRYNARIRSLIPSNQRSFSLQLFGRTFSCEVLGVARFAITLKSGNELTIKMMKANPTGEGTPAIHIIFHQKSCYNNMKAVYGEVINWITSEFGPANFWWGNVDLCVHVEGYNFDLVEDHDKLYGLYFQKNGFLMSQEDYKTVFTGFQVGSYKSERIVARIYDKLEKVRRGRNNGKSFLDPRPYYRSPSLCKRPWVIEFSFMHKFLKDHGIISGNDLWDKLPELWRYGTQKYLIHTSSKEDKKTPSEFWEWVSELWGEGVELQKRIPVASSQDAGKTVKTFNQIRSQVTGLMNELPLYQQEIYKRELINHISKSNNTHQVD